MALALLASGLLLLGGLLADVEHGLDEAVEEAQHRFLDSDPERLPPDTPLPDGLDPDLERIQSMRLGTDVDLELPEGTQWDGDTLEIQEQTTIQIPEGTALNDLQAHLPKGTHIDFGPYSRVRDGDMYLSSGTLITFPDGERLRLVHMGTLTHHGLDPEELGRALAHGELTLKQGALLNAARAVTDNAWELDLEEGTRFTLPNDRQGPTSPTDYSDQSTMGTHTTLPAGSTLHSQGIIDGAGKEARDLPGGAMPPIQDTLDGGGEQEEDPLEVTSIMIGEIGSPPAWSWALLILTILLLGILIAVRRKRTKTAQAPRFRLNCRIADRTEGLPLGLAPGQSATLHVKVEAQNERDLRRLERGIPIDLRIPGTNRHRGLIDTQGLQVPLKALGPGDHALRVSLRPNHWPAGIRLETAIRIAAWPEQIARDYQRLVDTLHGHDDRLPLGATPRQVRKALRALLPQIDEDTTARLVATFEEANYSPRSIEQDDWIRFVTVTTACEKALGRGRPQTMAARPMDAPKTRDRNHGRITG